MYHKNRAKTIYSANNMSFIPKSLKWIYVGTDSHSTKQIIFYNPTSHYGHLVVGSFFICEENYGGCLTDYKMHLSYFDCSLLQQILLSNTLSCDSINFHKLCRRLRLLFDVRKGFVAFSQILHLEYTITRLLGFKHLVNHFQRT